MGDRRRHRRRAGRAREGRRGSEQSEEGQEVAAARERTVIGVVAWCGHADFVCAVRYARRVQTIASRLRRTGVALVSGFHAGLGVRAWLNAHQIPVSEALTASRL